MALTDTFDIILNRILTDYQAINPAADVSRGSLLFMRAVALASTIWGLKQDARYVDAQRFADTCDEETLDHYISVRGLPVVAGEALAAKRARVLEDIRYPPAGGNRHDYVRWAKEASPLIADAWCVPLGLGPGTVDVVVIADAAEFGTEIADENLLQTVFNYIVDVCPIDLKYLRVLAPEVVTQDVTVAREGSVYPADTAQADIATYMAGMIPGQKLYIDQLKMLALGGGEGKATVSEPADDVVPTAYQMVRPGAISVA